MEKLGLVGLANSGKSSLFNTLTGGRSPVGPAPFTTTDTHVGVAPVYDARLDRLAELASSRKLVRAGFEVVDIAGLVAGSSTGEGLGNRFLGGVREVTALALVVRGFEDPTVVGETDPVAALQILELELVMADISTLEAALIRRRKASRAGAGSKEELDALEAALASLQAGLPLFRAELAAEVRQHLNGQFLVTDKPVICVLNKDSDVPATVTEQLAAELRPGIPVVAVDAKVELEANDLDVAERAEFLAEFGLGEGALASLTQTAFALLGRRTFFTTGEKESRAWTFRAGAKAPECAGVIHSDLARGFIRAEVIAYDDLVAAGGWTKAKSAGQIRLEGKEYVVADGDVLEIRFNV